MNKDVTEMAFGPHLFGAKLHIDDCFAASMPTSHTVVVDVETDEKDSFVGCAITANGQDIFYYSKLSEELKIILETNLLVGHNLKGDMKWLVNWGVQLSPSLLNYDTCLASYVQNTTKESHGLKDLAKEFLGMEWPSYKEMVGKGKGKLTLDKQPVERVAAYCSMDCLATYRLWQHFQKALTPQQKRYLETIELPTARVLLEMELKGAAVDVPYLNELKARFNTELLSITKDINYQWNLFFPGEALNVNSNKQIATLLEAQGAVLPLTPKGSKKVDKATLKQWTNIPTVPLLLEYSKYEKLLGTYVEPLLEQNKDGRIYASFNQISKDIKGQTFGISTGRLSSSSPNLQNIPSRTDEGSLIRKTFIAGKEKVLVDADYSQIEPRLVAHFSKDPLFLRSFREGRDIYQELVEGTGRDRQDGKTFMLALLYGAQPKKLASVFKCSEQEAQDIIGRIMRKLPGVTAWLNRTKYEARQKKGIWTLFKRWIPLPGIESSNPYERMHWERAAVNYSIQGSAAELNKKGLIELQKAGMSLILNVHDEVLIETEQGKAVEQANEVKRILESIIRLDVPIEVDTGIGENWERAKENSKK